VPFAVAGGHRVEIDRIPGAAPTMLVFLHEGLGSIAGWRSFPRDLAEATGCRAIVYSRWGYGGSDPVTLPRPLSFMHDEARGALPDLLAAEGIDDAILVGHSDGASIAIIHAGSIGGGVRGLVLMAPHVFVEDVCVTSIAKIRAEYASTDLRDKLARRHADVDGAFYGWADAWLDPEFRTWNLEAFLPGIRVPVLVIQGEDDEYGTIAQVDAIEAGVRGRFDRRILARSGHSPHRDQPEETLAASAAFVRSVLG
jgi:pimeloyl-ACP methyl ester carboxylesterase